MKKNIEMKTILEIKMQIKLKLKSENGNISVFISFIINYNHTMLCIYFAVTRLLTTHLPKIGLSLINVLITF